MEFRKKVEALLNVFLEGRSDLFLIDLKVSAGNDITVILDGDQGVSIQDCLDASRSIENNLDREEEDFSLQVLSSGVSEPLALPRQYRKNNGRTLEITLNSDEKLEGELKEADEEKITITRKYRKPKEVGKGKVDVVEDVKIPYTDIKKAIVVIKF